LEKKQKKDRPKGDFVAKYNSEAFKFFNAIQESSKNKEHLIIDARSANRFKGIVPEPRKGLRSGNIPNSVNLPFTNLLENGHYFKSSNELDKEFNAINAKEQHLVFSCGSGITACVLALGAELIGKTNYSVYDGSWTEYGSLTTE
jgi:thiosulfate/3-mercaptopyruvate sulfurtransferase